MSSSPHDRRVVITGLGTINPLGATVKEYWENLAAGRSGVRQVQSVDVANYKTRIAAEIDLPDLSAYFPKKKSLERFDRYMIFAHVAATQAILDSGIDIGAAPHRYGTIIGTGDAGIGSHHKGISTLISKGPNLISPFFLVNCVPNMASGFVSIQNHLEGPSFSVSSACATSNHALGLAAMLIKFGMADAMFAGGSEAVVQLPAFASFGIVNALSTRNDSPETASRPFDKERDGFVLAEGAGVLCLEEFEHAARRGAHIYGELSGFAFSGDAHDMVAPHPEGKGAAAAMEGALRNAGLNVSDIDLVNAHGTSTVLGDLIEAKAINHVFGDLTKKIPVHATKSMTGHLIGAAGAIEAIASLMAIKRGIIHPTINQFEQDPEINLQVVRNEAREADVKHVLSNGFGFGGQNASVVLSRLME